MKQINNFLGDVYSRAAAFFSSALFRTSLIATFVISMLANAFAYLNLYPQHDGINHMFEFAGSWELSLGRFLLPLFGNLQGQITMPWLLGVGSILVIGLLVCIVCDLTEMKQTWQVILVAGVLSANLSITELASVFPFTLIAYMLAALFSCLGVYVLLRLKSSWRYALAVVCLVVSMGLYQAEIVVGITLVVLLVLKDLIANWSFHELFMKYFRVILTFIVAAAVYFVVYKLCLKVSGIAAANSYNSLSNLGSVDMEELLVSIRDAYGAFFRFLYTDACFVGVTVTRTCNIVLTVLAVVLLLAHMSKNKVSWLNRGLIVTVLAVLPCIICILDIFMSSSKLSFYLLYAFYLYYVLLLAVIVQCVSALGIKCDSLIKSAIILCFFLITAQNIIFSNQVYSYQKIMYDRSVSIAGRILDKVESNPEYEIGQTEVVLIGSLRDNADLKKTLLVDEALPNTLQKNQGLRSLVNSSALNGGKTLSITYNQTFDSFVWLLGSELNYVTDKQIVSAYTASQEVADMPAYPKEGCCRMIDGRMVIKLS